MTRRSLITLLGATVAALGVGTTGYSSDIILNVQVDTTNHTWAVAAVSSDLQNLGIAAIAIDVLGGGGISVLKAANPSDTNQSPAGYFSLFRTTGTISGQNLVNIFASQDTITAADSFD